MYAIAVNGYRNECIDTVRVGSISHNSNTIPNYQTFILAGYEIPCSGTVVAWEFCYQRSTTPRTLMFYPSVWRNRDDVNYELIHFNIVIYDPSTLELNQCPIVKLPRNDQFTAPKGSVVGLYSGDAPLLRSSIVRGKNGETVNTYKIAGNQTSVSLNSEMIADYSVAIKLHLSKYYGMCV